MILPDNTPPSPTKSRASPLSPVLEEAQEDRIPPPPAYPGHTSYRHQDADVEAQVGTLRTPLVHVQRPSRPAHNIEQFEPAPKRFLKAFGLAILIYIVVGSFTRTAISGRHRPSGRRHVKWPEIIADPAPNIPDDGCPLSQIPFPKPSDGKLISCSSASDALQLGLAGSSAVPVTSFLLPLSADLLSIWGRGALSQGAINFVPTTDKSIPEGSIRVDITPLYTTRDALRLANICLLEPASNHRSVAILTPSRWGPASDLEFTVSVHLPVPARSEEPLHVKAFETKLPLFTHVFSDLEGKVSFGLLKVSSANKPIHGGYIEAENATIVTSNAWIDGQFHVSRSLDLWTSNQPIHAEVILDHNAVSQGDASTNLTMHTTNALLHSTISLRSTPHPRSGGAFSISAHTENGALDLSFPEQPADSTLTLSARTSNSPATVHLHPAFEGQFEIGTTNGPVGFDLDMHASDPAHKGRSRLWFLTERTMKVWRGVVSWGRPNDLERDFHGWVSLETENGAVELTA